MAAPEYVLAPKEAAGDDYVRLVEWMVADGGEVARGTAIALADTTKAAFEIESEHAGFLFHMVKAGDRVPVGAPIAVISADNVRPAAAAPDRAATEGAPASEQTFSKKALALIEEHRIPKSAFAALAVVRQSDVEAHLAAARPESSTAARLFGTEALDPGADWDAVLTRPDLQALQATLTDLRRRLKAKYNRHVPLGTLLHDRWAVAAEYGFGEGTSVYDECLILGDVRMGKQCWVGPYTILDGNFAPLRIGDYTSIGSGSHIYSHNTIDRTITRGKAATFAAETVIGEACFISPMVMIGPGSRIGDGSFVAAGSFVQGEFDDASYIAGNPARRVGRVEVRHGRVFLLKDE